MPPLDLARDTIRAFQRNGLPDLASAMAFQAILAIVPFLLFVGVDGSVRPGGDLARGRVAGRPRSGVEIRLRAHRRHRRSDRRPAAALVADGRIGADALGALRRHARDDDRAGPGVRLLPPPQHFREAAALAGSGAAVGICVVAAIAMVRFGPLVTGELDGVLAVVSFLVRWLLARQCWREGWR